MPAACSILSNNVTISVYLLLGGMKVCYTHFYHNVNTVLWGDDKGNCTATTLYSVITGIYKPSATPPTPALQGGIPGRTHTHTLFWSNTHTFLTHLNFLMFFSTQVTVFLPSQTHNAISKLHTPVPQ